MGQYEIIALIGQCRMGDVYLALDRRLGREVALKLLTLTHSPPMNLAV